MRFRGLNRLTSQHSFEQTQTLILHKMIVDPRFKDDFVSKKYFFDTIANTYRPYVTKVIISLDHFTVAEMNLILRLITRDRLPLETLRITSVQIKQQTPEILNMLQNIPLNIANRIYIDIPLKICHQRIYEFMAWRFGESLVGLFLARPRLDLIMQYYMSFRIEILRVLWICSLTSLFDQIPRYFPYLSRLHLYGIIESFTDVLKVPMLLSNLTHFAYHGNDEARSHVLFNEYDQRSNVILRSLAKRGLPALHTLSQKEVHFVYSSNLKSLWCVTDTLIGYPKLPLFVKNISFHWNKEDMLQMESIQGVNLLRKNPQVKYFRCRKPFGSFFYSKEHIHLFDKDFFFEHEPIFFYDLN